MKLELWVVIDKTKRKPYIMAIHNPGARPCTPWPIFTISKKALELAKGASGLRVIKFESIKQ